MGIKTGNVPLKFYASSEVIFLEQLPSHHAVFSKLNSGIGVWLHRKRQGGWNTENHAVYYISRRNSMQLQPQPLPSSCLLRMHSFWGMFQVKSQRCQVFMMKICRKKHGLSLFGCGHQSCTGCSSGETISHQSGKIFLFVWFTHQFWLAVKRTKETLNCRKYKTKHVQISADVSLTG